MHLTREAIRTLLTAPAADTPLDHLTLCPACGAAADEVALDLGLGEELAWELASLPEIPRENSGSPLDARAAERLSRAGDVSEIVSDPMLASDDGMLALLRAAHALLNVAPTRLRDLAGAILDRNPSDAVAVVALRERANALRRTGELPEALATIARGREIAERLVVSEHELAIFDYIEALVFVDQSAPEAARRNAERAVVAFMRFGDTRRKLYAQLLLAGLDYEMGRVDEARTTFRSLAAPLAAIGDRAASVGAWQNAGDCSLQLGEFDTARAELIAAECGYRELGLTTEVLRVRWLLARVEIGEQRLEEAKQALNGVAHDLEASGLKLDAALARLDLVELLQRTERHDEAAGLARLLATVFASTGARGRLAEALTLLRDTAERGSSLDEPLREARAAVLEVISSPAQA